MKKVDRTEAENLYASWIVEKGNPHYFIHKVLQNWEDYELEEQYEMLTKVEIKIVEEE